MCDVRTKGALEARGHVRRKGRVSIEKIRQAGAANAQPFGGLIDRKPTGQNVATDVVA